MISPIEICDASFSDCGPGSGPHRSMQDGAWQAAGSTFSAFLICGLVPMIPFVAGLKNAFWVASAVTSLIFVLIGALKSRWSTRPWWHSGLTTLAIGGGAAAVAYGIGAWLRGVTG